jgi:hypothetical protein
MNASTPSTSAAKPLSDVEAEISTLVEQHIPKGPPQIESEVERIRSSLARLTSNSIEGLQGLTSELQEVQRFLNAEVERVEGEIESALAGIKKSWKPSRHLKAAEWRQRLRQTRVLFAQQASEANLLNRPAPTQTCRADRNKMRGLPRRIERPVCRPWSRSDTSSPATRADRLMFVFKCQLSPIRTVTPTVIQLTPSPSRLRP